MHISEAVIICFAHAWLVNMRISDMMIRPFFPICVRECFLSRKLQNHHLIG